MVAKIWGKINYQKFCWNITLQLNINLVIFEIFYQNNKIMGEIYAGHLLNLLKYQFKE